MNLKILLPFQVFAENKKVSRIVAETVDGSFGILPHRLDCVAALTPGILIYQIGSGSEVYVAIDQGILVKTGKSVLISVRRALTGTDLASLREEVEKEFLSMGEKEKNIHSVLAKMESGFIRRLAEFKHG